MLKNILENLNDNLKNEIFYKSIRLSKEKINFDIRNYYKTRKNLKKIYNNFFTFDVEKSIINDLFDEYVEIDIYFHKIIYYYSRQFYDLFRRNYMMNDYSNSEILFYCNNRFIFFATTKQINIFWGLHKPEERDMLLKFIQNIV